jgi:hypothetical protein
MANPVAKLPTTAADTSMGAGIHALTIMPQSISEVIAFADRMAGSRFVPPHLRGKPEDCFAVAMQAFRWQMDPFSVASKSYFVNDRMAYEAQLINSVVYAHAPLVGRLDIKWEGAWPARICIVTGMIIGDKNPKVRRVDARTITTRNSPLWKSDPDQQLAYFSTRAWARLFTPDVLMGVYAPEEFRGETIEGESILVAPETPEGTKLDAMEAMIDGGNPAPTDATFGLPMVWPDEMADKVDWKLAFERAKKEIEALPDADACDRWEEVNSDGLNILMRLYNVSYQKLGDMLAAKREAQS